MMRSISKYAPFLIGALFAYSGIYKLIHPGQATAALMALDLNPRLAQVTIIAVTIVELYLGAILLLELDIKYALLSATGVILLFTLFLFYLNTLAHPPSCGCMGLTSIFHLNRHNAIFGLLRNCVILWILKGGYDYHCKHRGDSRQAQR